MRGDMIEIFKHFHVYDQDIISPSFQPRHRPSRQRPFQLHQMNPRDGVRGLEANAFYNRSVKLWNDLPRHVVNSENINIFKNRLDAAWKETPFKFNHKLRNTSDS